MISIIICSRVQKICKKLSQNIEETIGCSYEIIIIDNSLNKYSIFEAYNLGIERSKGAYLCFIHDDVLFHTQKWGEVINRIFSENPKVGLLGIAGAKSKTKMPSAWWDCPEEHKFINIKQHFKNGETEDWNFGFTNLIVEEVVLIDGVFMVLKKDEDLFFDISIGSFHNYDLNISFECLKIGKKIVVTNQILIEHFSLGTINEEWVVSTYNIYKKYKNILPLYLNVIAGSKKNEISCAKKFIELCLNNDQYKLAILIWLELFCFSPFLKFHLRFWIILIKKIVK